MRREQRSNLSLSKLHSAHTTTSHIHATASMPRHSALVHARTLFLCCPTFMAREAQHEKKWRIHASMLRQRWFLHELPRHFYLDVFGKRYLSVVCLTNTADLVFMKCSEVVTCNSVLWFFHNSSRRHPKLQESCDLFCSKHVILQGIIPYGFRIYKGYPL